MFSGASLFSLGLVLRNASGSFIWVRVVRVEGCIFVFEVEIFWVLESLSWIVNEYHQPVIVETDSMHTIQALHR